MRDLAEIRKDINAIDLEMAILFEKRMNCAKEVALYKKACQIPIFDGKREQEVIDSNLERVEPELRPYYETFLRRVMDISKELQQTLICDEN